MSGAEVIGLISGTIAIFEFISKLYEQAKDAGNLPEQFCEVALRLPLVHGILQTTQQHINECSVDEKSSTKMKSVVESCKSKAETLRKIFEEVAPKSNTSRTQRYSAALRMIGKEN